MASRASTSTAAFLLLVAALAGCLEDGGGPGAGEDAFDGEESFTVVERGSQSGIDEERSVLVRNEEEWKALWREHSRSIPPEEPPHVDFDTLRVLAVFAGDKPNPGWGLTVLTLRTHAHNATTVAHVELTPPDPDRFYPEVIAQPFEMVAFEKRDTVVDVAWHGVRETAGEHAKEEPSMEDTNAADRDSFTVLDQGPWSRVEEARTVLVTDEATWQAVWAEHGGHGESPEVDFATTRILAAFLGARPTTGYAIEVEGVTTDASAAVTVVHLREIEPDPNGTVGMAFTHPFVFVAFDVQPTEVEVEWLTK